MLFSFSFFLGGKVESQDNGEFACFEKYIPYYSE